MTTADGWKRMRFKNNKVWMALTEGGAPLTQNGKNLIKYQLDQPHEYWVATKSLSSLDDPAETEVRKASQVRRPASLAPPDEAQPVNNCQDGICIYTDGASSGNPGPAGIGVVMRYKEQVKEISRYLGVATNNQAELEAIRTALTAVKNRRLPVFVHTDSRYAWGLLTQNWKATQNKGLVKEIRDLMLTFARLKLIKVKGHAGNADNERADRLAVTAAKGSGDTK